VDNDSFVGSPLPPEEPTAENPPNGAVIDYYLNAAAGKVKLEIFDDKANPVRSFVANSREAKHPPMAIAERWFPKPEALEKTAGMHRFVWNLAWGNSGGESGDPEDDDFSAPHAPRVVPGVYQVRLTVDGKTWTQPLKVAMDPRSTATPEELEKQFELGRTIFVDAMRCRQSLAEIQAVQKQLGDLKLDAGHGDLKTAVNQVQEEIKRITDGEETAGSMGLTQSSSGLSAALRVVESSDRAIPAQATAVYEPADQAMKARIAQWTALKSGHLVQLNDQLKQGNLKPIAIAEIEREVEYFMSR
jgi:hypothetical protein